MEDDTAGKGEDEVMSNGKKSLVSVLQAQCYDTVTAQELVTKFMITLDRMKPGKYKFIIGKERVTVQIEKEEAKCICEQGLGLVYCPIHGFTGGLRG